MDQNTSGTDTVAAGPTPRTACKPFVVGRRGTMRSTGYGRPVRWEVCHVIGEPGVSLAIETVDVC
jgi:hypothetical protein